MYTHRNTCTDVTRLDTHLFLELSAISFLVQEELGQKLIGEPVLEHEIEKEIPLLTQPKLQHSLLHYWQHKSSLCG